MRYLLVFLAFFASNIFAFNPNDIIGAEIKQVAPCNQMTCALVEKDGKKYVIMGIIDDDTMDMLAIFIVENKKLRLIWSFEWRDT